MKNSENKKIVILCHGAFNYIKNKTGNMLIRYRESDVVAVIDHENLARLLLMRLVMVNPYPLSAVLKSV
ncbi:hypothetical protein CM15mP37_09340 [bacterium]|nr:MAG: hypothetical protein CM15mP37_09340 [bacterium]